jgi:hypothetical protein
MVRKSRFSDWQLICKTNFTNFTINNCRIIYKKHNLVNIFNYGL